MKKLLFIRGGFHKEFAYKTFIKQGNEMIMMDVPESMQISLADYQYTIKDINDQQDMYRVAKRIHEEIGFDGIVTFMNSPVPVIGKLSDELHLDYFSEQTGEILNNKYELRNQIAKTKLSNLRFQKITKLEDAKAFAEMNGFPWVLKPTDTASSRGVSIISKKEEIDQAYAEAMKCSVNQQLIAEDFIHGEEHCAEILVVNGKVFVLGISKKVIDEETKTIELMDVTPAPKYAEIYPVIKELMEKLVEQLAIHNWLLHVEFKYLNGGVEIIELNPRAAGANLLESEFHLKGVNPYELLFKAVLKEPIDLAELQRKIDSPYDGCSVFYSYITPKEEGMIQGICGIPEISQKLKPRERINLFFKKGDVIQIPTSNNDFRGTLYLFGKKPEEVMNRALAFEKALKYEVIR